jgi:Putative zinc-finger
MPNPQALRGKTSAAPRAGTQVKLIKTKERFGESAVEMLLSLSDLMRIATIQSPAPERSGGRARPCAEWELALHAFFDEELDAADSFTCEQHLAQCQGCSLEVENLKAMRRKIERFAMGWHASAALRNRSAG